MPLQKQEISIAFTEGVDTKTDEKIATKLSVLENACIGQNLTINKRNGFESLNNEIVNAGDYDATSPFIKGEIIFANKDQLGILNKDTVAIYNDQNSKDWYIPGPQALNCQVEIQSIDFPNMSGTSRGVQAVMGPNDIIICGNYITPSREYATGIIRKNISTGAIIAPDRAYPSPSATASGRLASLNGKVYWFITENNLIFFFDVTTYSPTLVTNTLVNDVLSTGHFDVFVENGKIHVVYTETSGKLKVVSCNSSMIIQNTFTNSTETKTIQGTSSLAWNSSLGRYHLIYVTTSSGVMYHNALSLTSSLVLSGAISTLNLGSNYESSYPLNTSISAEATSSRCFYEFALSQGDKRLYSYAYDGISISGGTALVGTRLAAKSFTFNGETYIPTRVLTTGAEREVLLNSAFLPVCLLSMDSQLIDIEGLGVYSPEIGIPLGVSQYGSSIVKLVTDDLTISSPRETLDSTFMSLGAGFVFDGATYSECGFISPPVYYGMVASSGVGTVPAGTYTYAITFSHVDLSGNVYESAPTYSGSITIGSAKNIAVSVGVCSSRRSDDKNTANLYRRDTDQIYKLVASKSFAEIIMTGQITDARASLSGQPTLYTTGGILENDPPPPCNIFTTHGDRVFCVNEERPVEIYFSKKVQAGEGIHFSSFLYFSVNENKNATYERVTGLGSLDDKLIVFKKHSIFAVFGDGPNALGVGSFSEPKLISTDVGCRDARSIVSTSEGLMFMSSKGIYILTRSLEVVYVGADVEAFNSKEITSALLLPNLNQVRFTTRNSIAITYSYLTQQWSWQTNYESQHALIWKNIFTHLKSNGLIKRENTGFLDNSTVITQKIGIGWVKLNGIQGYQRIYRVMFVGDFKSTHKVRAKVYYDFENYAWEEIVITPRPSGYNTTSKPNTDDIHNGGNDGIYQFEIQLSRQKCQAFKIEISDFDQIGESFSLSGVSMIVGVKRGLNKLASNKKF